DERRWYDAHKAELAEPERVRIARVFVATTGTDRAKAQRRAEKLASRWRAGEPAEKVGSEGDGPERARGGELGLFARGELKEKKTEEAAFALGKPGAVSPTYACEGGFCAVRLIERRQARVPSLEESRAN